MIIGTIQPLVVFLHFVKLKKIRIHWWNIYIALLDLQNKIFRIPTKVDSNWSTTTISHDPLGQVSYKKKKKNDATLPVKICISIFFLCEKLVLNEILVIYLLNNNFMPCLPADCYFSKLALWKSNSALTSSSSHWLEMLSWR